MFEYGHVVRECSRLDEHAPDCDGTCGDYSPTNLEIDLHNEAVEWSRRGMAMTGVPRSLTGAVPGIQVEIFDLELRFAGLIKYLTEKFPEFSRDEATIAYQQVRLAKLRDIRQSAEKAQSPLAVAQSRLLGPDGEVIH